MQAVAIQDEFGGSSAPSLRDWMRRNRLLLMALALSLLVHGLLLLWHRNQTLNTSGARQEVAGDMPLAVTLALPPPKQGPSASAQPETAPPAHRAPAPHRAPPPVISTPRSTPLPVPPPVTQPLPPAPIAPPVPAPPGDTPAPPMDMMAQINAARQRRREAAGPVPAPDAPPTEDQRAMGNALRNLRSLTPGQNEGTNGVFSITRVGYTSADFTFRGWNTNFQRNWNETITVERGNNPDIHLAVVRKMIEIIRRYETRDFHWESPRLGRTVMLSARQEDTVGLEDFLLKEFFPEYRRQ